MMTGSAQVELQPEFLLEEPPAPRQTALQRQVAEKLAQHRQRRGQASAAAAYQDMSTARSPKHRIAAAVAERYAQTPSYRAILAEQAKRAIQEAAAAAEVAVRNAEAVAAAQQELLGELELWSAPQEFTVETAVVEKKPKAPAPRAKSSPMAAANAKPAGLTVRLYEDLREAASSRPEVPRPLATVPVPHWSQLDVEEALALDAEIAFRQAPVFEDFGKYEAAVPLPANLLEFPRQLVAARKARPRLAEGPLRDEIAPRTRQLRIFEVEPEQISIAPAVAPAAPEWTSSIRLDAHTVTEAEEHPESPVMASLLPPQTAPLTLRLMAELVDGMLVAGAFLGFVAVFAKLAGEIPLGVPAAVAAVTTLGTLYLLYQVLFFSLSGQTPGMRYARIGLCTFSDENPTRSAMRRRILAQMIAVCPLGLGLLWALLDDDGLGWHDRISRMYQRAY